MRRKQQWSGMTSDPAGCLGNFLFFSVPIEQKEMFACWYFPFSKKISLLHSHVLFLLCVELNLVLDMGSCQVFIFIVFITKHLPCQFLDFLLNQQVMFASWFLEKPWKGEVLPFTPIKCYRASVKG